MWYTLFVRLRHVWSLIPCDTNIQTVRQSPRTETAQLHSLWPMLLSYIHSMDYGLFLEYGNNMISGEAKKILQNQDNRRDKRRNKITVSSQTHCTPASGIHLSRPGQVMSNTCVCFGCKRGQLNCTGRLLHLLWLPASFNDFSDSWMCFPCHHVELQMKWLQGNKMVG